MQKPLEKSSGFFIFTETSFCQWCLAWMVKRIIQNLKQLRIIAMSIAALLVFNAGLLADSVPLSNNPYGPAVARNIFGLNPLVVPPTPRPVEPLAKIMPTGIISIFGQAQVLFKVATKTEKEASYIFAEGQEIAEGQEKIGIKVIKIDEEKGLVTFNNHGLIQELALGGAPADNAEPVNLQR